MDNDTINKGLFVTMNTSFFASWDADVPTVYPPTISERSKTSKINHK